MRWLSSLCLSFGPQPGPESSSTSISTICSTPFTTRGTRIFFFGFGDGDGCACCGISVFPGRVVLSLRSFGGRQCCFENSGVGAAPAEVSLASFAHLGKRWIGVLLQVRRDRSYESRCAEAAHQRVVFDERRLHRVWVFR